LCINPKHENKSGIVIEVKERKDREFTDGSMLDTYVYHYELVLRVTLCST
jgi:hypothetical protein